MTFKDMLKAKDEAAEDAELAESLLEEAAAGHAKAEEHHRATADAVANAHRTIHEHLTEFGAHVLVDPKDGQATVYTAIDDFPGWRAHHPISGDAELAPKKEAEAV